MSRASRPRPSRSTAGFALLEMAIVTAVFSVLMGAIFYTVSSALTLTSRTANETHLLFRVGRVFDRFEINLASATRESLAMIPEGGGVTLANLIREFRRIERVGEDAKDDEDKSNDYLDEIGDKAKKAADKLVDAIEKLEDEKGPDIKKAADKIDDALDEILEMVDKGYDPIEGKLRSIELQSLQAEIVAGDLSNVRGVVKQEAWESIEEFMQKSVEVKTTPLVFSDHVLYRETVAGDMGPEIKPPLSEPAYAYYVRPMASNPLLELVHFDGKTPRVVMQDLTSADFERITSGLKLTLRVADENEESGVRVESRTILVRLP